MQNLSKLINPVITADEKRDMQNFWKVLQVHEPELNATMTQKLMSDPTLDWLIKLSKQEEYVKAQLKSRELRNRAFETGDWAEFLQESYNMGYIYAQHGLRFHTWFEIITMFRENFLPILVDEVVRDAHHAKSVIRGMEKLLQLSTNVLCESYIRTKEDTILAQQKEIQDVSTPVLQLRAGLLLLPIIGAIDTQRARQLMENLLTSIRDRRASMIVMDITGVPIVDSKVANHLLQAIDAAKLMGARVILTGISPQIAQTLVAIGAQLGDIQTLGDLESGIRAAERYLHANNAG